LLAPFSLDINGTLRGLDLLDEEVGQTLMFLQSLQIQPLISIYLCNNDLLF